MFDLLEPEVGVQPTLSRRRFWRLQEKNQCSRAIDEKAQSILVTQYYYGKGYNFLQVLYNLRVWFST